MTQSEAVGGKMTLPGAVQSAGSTSYFRVEEIEAAIDRVKQNGGARLGIVGPGK